MRNTVILLIDAGIAITSFWSAVLLRTNFTAQVFTFRELVVYSLLVVGAAVAMAEITGWLHRSWRFLVASTIVHAMLFAAFVVSLATLLIFLYDRLVLLPRSVPVLFYSLFFAWILLPRVLYGCWRSRCRRNGGPTTLRHEPAGAALSATVMEATVQPIRDHNGRMFHLATGARREKYVNELVIKFAVKSENFGEGGGIFSR